MSRFATGRVRVGIALAAGATALGGLAALVPSSPSTAAPTFCAVTCSVYAPLANGPVRVFDSRTGSNLPGAGETIPQNGVDVVKLPTTGSDAVPTGATAVVLNVTAVDATVQSYFTVYPTGDLSALQPGNEDANFSNVNFSPGPPQAALVTVPIGMQNSVPAVSVYNHSGSADVVVDLQGYFVPNPGNEAGQFFPLTPARITDTRPNSGYANAGKTLGAGSTLAVQVTGEGGVPTPSTGVSVSAVELNITAADTNANSFFTVWPDGQAQPLASDLNWTSGETIANRVIVPVSQTTGEVDIYNLSGNADVVVDVDGWFSGSTYTGIEGSGYVPIAPDRVSDTRPGSGEPNEASPLGALGTETVQVSGTGGGPGVPAESVTPVTAADVNVTEATSSAGGYLTVYPAIDSAPVASDLNFVAGDVIANSDMVGLSPSGAIGILNYTGTTNVAVDVFGYFTPVLQDTVTLAGSASGSLTHGTGTTTLTVTVMQGTNDVPGDPVIVTESGICGTFSNVSNGGTTNSAGTQAAALTPSSGQITLTYTAGAVGSCTVVAGETQTDDAASLVVVAD